ncbi:MAG: DUF433 domain-containing protein [Acidobacteria bacterium]|nr:DUF433 domain-containing protein [Acidobacteriota bacterium]
MEEILADYPQLRGEHILAALRYAAQLATEETILAS